MFKMRKIIIVLTVVMAAGFLFQYSVSFADDDLKLYNFYQLKYKIDDRFDVFIQPDTRFRDDIGELYYHHIRAGVVFHKSKSLDLGATYRFARNKNSSGTWLDENRYELEVSPKVKIGDFSLSDRSRLEYRGLEDSRDRWRYRNLFKVAWPVKRGTLELKPYVSEEIFYDFEVDKMNLNWATVGADRKITDHLLLGLFYRNEATRVGTKNEWDTNHYIGTKVVVSF